MPVTKKRKIELKIENATSYDITILDNRVKQLEGLISDEDGITVDFSNYYKKAEVDELISNIDVDVDLSDYATLDQLDTEKEFLRSIIEEKQDVIEDLSEIREKANSALTWTDRDLINQEIEKKQDAISDIEEIRAGAALGSTAIQEHQSLAEYAKKSEIPDISVKQDIISDLDDIRSKANSALQEHQSLAAYAKKTEIPDITVKQDVITDLATIRAGAALGATALQTHQDISGKADKTQLNDYYTKTEIDAQLDGLDEILVKILE